MSMCEAAADTNARLTNLVANTHTLERTLQKTLDAMAAVENARGMEGFFKGPDQDFLHRAQYHAENAVTMLQIYKERLEYLSGAPGVHSLEQDADAHGFYRPNTGAK
jgi:hypothetical protein